MDFNRYIFAVPFFHKWLLPVLLWNNINKFRFWYTIIFEKIMIKLFVFWFWSIFNSSNWIKIEISSSLMVDQNQNSSNLKLREHLKTAGPKSKRHMRFVTTSFITFTGPKSIPPCPLGTSLRWLFHLRQIRRVFVKSLTA